MTKKVILFLYTERSSYLDNCLKELAQEQIEVHLVSYPVNKEAPFVFSGSTFYNYERDQFKNKIELHLNDQITNNNTSSATTFQDIQLSLSTIALQNQPKVTSFVPGTTSINSNNFKILNQSN